MKKICLSLMLVLILLSTAGCGNSEELQALQNENASLKTSIEDLQKQNDQLQKEIEMYVPKKEHTSSTEAKNQPVELVNLEYGYDVVTNVHIKFKNVSTKTIDAVEFVLLHFDNFGRPACYDDDKSIGNVSKKLNLQSVAAPNEVISGGWNFFVLDSAKKGKAVVKQVHFTDGSTWVNQQFDDIVAEEKQSLE